MTKKDIVDRISIETGIEKLAIKTIVEQLMQEIKDSVVSNEPVYLRGFATFEAVKRNTKNFHAAPGHYILIPEHYEPKVKFCKEFRDAVNKTSD